MEASPKLQLVPGASSHSATFVVTGEDHTLGNALRWVLMRHAATTFCGYSMPHPSEPVINVRLQTSGAAAATSAHDVFREGLVGLTDVAHAIGSAFDEALARSRASGAGAGAGADGADGDGDGDADGDGAEGGAAAEAAAAAAAAAAGAADEMDAGGAAPKRRASKTRR